ncbi:hypothetical protein K438DRAFT_1768201 [Mycena galopus ATCC 62051]|nr:hypothetical protein K438DRAFT_1768201 [Mycena galopus ATCC 62051]
MGIVPTTHFLPSSVGLYKTENYPSRALAFPFSPAQAQAPSLFPTEGSRQNCVQPAAAQKLQEHLLLTIPKRSKASFRLFDVQSRPLAACELAWRGRREREQTSKKAEAEAAQGRAQRFAMSEIATGSEMAKPVSGEMAVPMAGSKGIGRIALGLGSEIAGAMVALRTVEVVAAGALMLVKAESRRSVAEGTENTVSIGDGWNTRKCHGCGKIAPAEAAPDTQIDASGHEQR